MLYFWKAKGPRTSKMIFWTVRYTNTQIQIHKYTNTACDEVPEIPNMCYIFEKPRVQGHQTWYSGLSNTHIHKYKCTNTQIQIHKNTNTQIQHMTKWQKYPTYAIFLNSWWFKDVKNDNPKCSDPRYTVDFCTVPPGLYHAVLCNAIQYRAIDYHAKPYNIACNSI